MTDKQEQKSRLAARLQRAAFIDDEKNVPAVRHQNPDGTDGPFVPLNAVIGTNVWLDPAVVVMPGASIGDNEQIFGSQIVLPNH